MTRMTARALPRAEGRPATPAPARALPRAKGRPATRGPARALRPVILALTVLLAGCGLAAPGPDRPQAVTVLGPWTGAQGDAFRALLDGSGVPYSYEGTAAQREVLLSQVQSGSPPDVAVLPGVGELAEYARGKHLRDLGSIDPPLYDPEQYGAPWQPRLPDLPGQVFWVPLKADLKSLVWYRKGEPAPTSPAPLPAWCMGMGDDGASGWPGSDWIEDLMLQMYGTEVYTQWATGSRDPAGRTLVPWTDLRVLKAWQTWSALMAQDVREKPGRTGTGEAPDRESDRESDRARGADPGEVPDQAPAGGAAERALLTDHRGEPHSGGLLFSLPGCSLEHQGSFARTAFYGDEHRDDVAVVGSERVLPGSPWGRSQAQARGREVSGDFAVLFNDTPGARRLLRHLASEEGQRSWARDAKVFSANSKVRVASDAADTFIEKNLVGGQRLCLDASDLMPATVRDAFYEATLLQLADPTSDPLPLLKSLQRVQQREEEETEPPWLTGVCSAPQ
ncbi:extracellular solute-binding protein [Streptomyces sp. NPDC091272]|uniref:extracellular solute-binding protein n=1 Tax=Streptomyces sp. NPDC091272 TaxID=3365981 RepID=UPI003828EC1C